MEKIKRKKIKMNDPNYNKNLTAAEYDAIIILQSHIPGFKKIEGDKLKLFYKHFEDHYRMKERRIHPDGEKTIVISHPLIDAVQWSRKFLQYYYNLRASYDKSVHFLGASFGNLLGCVQFGFKAGNPDILTYKKHFLENAQEISRILKNIKPNLKLKYVPKRILEIYHENPAEVHVFAAEFAQELSK